ncbi:MAG: transglutaminase domain-containing protein [Saprospiraceae bacterium]|nr:transglutaminase domain-containing protein [Saprospiraceae bacterium]
MKQHPNPIILLFLLCNITLLAQNYNKIDQRARTVPFQETTSINKLATYLTATAKNDIEKARAIYVWITHDITYNDTILVNGWLGTPENWKQQQAENVLKNRRAVCEGFANLYKALCDAAGLKAEFITGIVKNDNNVIADAGHAWNAVQVEGKWYLSDPTWGAGYADYWTNHFIQDFNEDYFLVSPSKMIHSHLPDDPIWQLLSNPLTEQEFRTLSADALDRRVITPAYFTFYYQDSIARWFQQDSVMRMIASSERILQYNPDNKYALARLGTHFYNLSLITYARVEELILNGLDDSKRSLDTFQIISMIIAGEHHVKKGWSYLALVNDSKLKLNIEELLSEQALLAEYAYLHGLLCTWRSIGYARKFYDNAYKMSINDIESIHAEGQRARQYLNSAKIIYNNRNKETYKNTFIKARLHEALLYFCLGQADAFYYGKWRDLNKKELEVNMAGLDRAENEYNMMNNIIAEILKIDANSILAGSLQKEYAGAMASLLNDKGYIYLAQLEQKYADEWKFQERIDKSMASRMLTDYRKCNDYCKNGLALLEQNASIENAQAIRDNLNTLRGNTYACLGDIQARLINNNLRSIRAKSDEKMLKIWLLQSIDEAIEHYREALTWLGSDKDIKSYLDKYVDRLKTIRQDVVKF